MADDDFQPAFAARLKRLREARKMTQGELGLEIRSVSGRSLVASWETNAQPGAMWIPRLALALRVSCDYLLTGEEHQISATG